MKKDNLIRAFENLKRSVSTPIEEPRDISGIIKDFELTYELSWKFLKKILLDQGHQTTGSKDVFSKAYQLGFLKEQDVWIEMITDRNQSTHVYDEKDALQLIERIKKNYIPCFESLIQISAGTS
jgi:nucleotidyltransferase substrate binding protein (TIGR01987 family)